MGDSETVNIQFILSGNHKNEDESSKDMLVCFKWCLENTMDPKWLKEEDCHSAKPGKKDVFVFEKFEGNAFAYLKRFKCVILGPQALLNCISEGKPIPKFGSTIFTNAMRDCLVCCTSIDGNGKEELRLKVTYMGGLFEGKHLLKGTTHLVAGNVLSYKYNQAVEAKIPIMTTQWVVAVWEASLERNIYATDKEFERFKCPAFLGLTITTSNLPRRDKEKVKLLVEMNGGTYDGSLQLGTTDILVMKGTQGEKYKCARENGLPCIEPMWITESSKLGHAIDTKMYEVSRKCSTPVDKRNADCFPPDMSVLSSIGYANTNEVDRLVLVNETVCSTASNITSRHPSTTSASRSEVGELTARHLEVLISLDMKKVKAAGHFLDGCKVFSIGFGPDASEKLRRVLNAGGATRFNELTDSVSHVLVGNTSRDTVEEMLQATTHRPFVVTVEWVLESIEIQGRAQEDKYLVTALRARPAAAEPPSPSLKKSLQMLRTPTVAPLVLEKEVAEDEQSVAAGQLIPQYLHKEKAVDNQSSLFKIPPRRETEAPQPQKPTQPQPTPVVDNEGEEDDESQFSPFFQGLKFLVVGFDDENHEFWTDLIITVGGEVVVESFRGVPDYVIVPFEGHPVRHAAKEVVSYLWLESCTQNNSKMPVEYYHQPVALPSVKPLKGCVIAISSYLDKERDFLILLSQALGAVSQDVFARRDCPPKQVLASTQLICAEPGSSKYAAAVKWAIPAVSHEWLLACLRERRLADVAPYRVTDGTVPRAPAAPTAPTANVTASTKTPDYPADRASGRKASSSTDRTTPPGSPAASAATSTNEPREPQSSEPEDDPSADGGHDENADSTNQPHANDTPRQTTPSNNPDTTAASSVSISGTPGIQTPAAPPGYGFSQETPIRFPRLSTAGTKRASSGKGKPGLETKTPETPYGALEMKTPDTPYGYGFDVNPSPNTRKNAKRWVDKFPDLRKNDSPERPAKKRKSTPLKDLYKLCWNKWVTAEDPESKDGLGPVRAPSHNQAQPISAMPADEAVEIQNVEGAGAYTQLNQLDQLLMESTSNNGNSADDGTKLTRRPSLRESPPNLKAGPSTRANSDNKAVEGNLKESQWSQSNDIGWKFHTPRGESREASPTVNNAPPKSAHDGPFKFILTTMTDVDRDTYKQVLLSLGGILCDEKFFDLSATHLVCMKPSRSEKMLACIASGKWVVHSSYLDKSKEAGYFLQEEEYEFGNPAAAINLPATTVPLMEGRLAAACFRWRTHLALNKAEKGAFHGMRAILCTNLERVESFKRLIIAGGGAVVDAQPPFSQKTSATHLFLDESKYKGPIDYKMLAEHSVLCLPVLFLNNFLVDNPAPIAADHVIVPMNSSSTRQSSRNKK